MTREFLKNSSAQGRKSFAAEPLPSPTAKITGELGPRRADVIFISQELRDSPEATVKAPQKMRVSPGRSAVPPLQGSKPGCVANVLSGGVRVGFCWSRSLKFLPARVQKVHQGQIWTNDKDLERFIHALAYLKPIEFNYSEEMPLLTRREKDVVRLVAEGLEDGEIAQHLNVKENSVRIYLCRILEKLGFASRVELILYASSQRSN